MTRFLLRCETVITWPFFLLSWSVSAVVHAAKARWHMATLKEEEKAQILDKLSGREASEKVDEHESV